MDRKIKPKSTIGKLWLSVTYLLEFIENYRKELISTTKSGIEILNSIRLGTTDYDFKSVKLINKGGQAFIFEIKSNVDGQTYVGKRL